LLDAYAFDVPKVSVHLVPRFEFQRCSTLIQHMTWHTLCPWCPTAWVNSYTIHDV